ncbi:MAG: lipoyl(octanoyl) transferase [Cytophagia bacterium]|nr:MAG: lipoyl(octanoyl) transferase [Cytophagales bacterium]TAG02914.1 MAG: lipoyl(octanoyl) transferase [Cytophagia bacterium]TAG42076.1 MAG: lipoyl(octanoyl) transferase [Cytophagia bacterium]TAH29057.1 MAG: lipoyl(octanoyl) transferase [Cytophagales bacterium]
MKNNVLIFKDLETIEYKKALLYQENLFQNAVQNKLTNAVQNIPHYLLFCEHLPVFTLGKSGKIDNLLLSEKELKEKNIDFFYTNRGGDITFHGQGQLTIYPIFDLEKLNISLREYIFKLEEIIIQFIKKYNLKGERIENAAGIWIEKNRKICAIGVKSSRMITMHGLGFNINTDLTYFDYINPCGFEDKGVGSLAFETKENFDMNEIKKKLLPYFLESFDLTLIDE